MYNIRVGFGESLADRTERHELTVTASILQFPHRLTWERRELDFTADAFCPPVSTLVRIWSPILAPASIGTSLIADRTRAQPLRLAAMPQRRRQRRRLPEITGAG
jgi:hypothetical protein